MDAERTNLSFTQGYPSDVPVDADFKGLSFTQRSPLEGPVYATVAAGPVFQLNVSVPWLVTYLVVYGVIVACSIVGNQLVIWSYLIEPKLRRPTNLLIVSLAVADFVTGALGVPLAVFGRLFTGPFICSAATRPIFYVVAFMMCSVSIVHLVVITLDRYAAVTRPLRYPTIMTSRRCKILIAFSWTIAVVFGSLTTSPPPDPTLWVCGTTNYERTTIDVQRIGIVSFIPAFLLALCLLYMRIFTVAWAHIRGQSARRSAQSGSAPVGKNSPLRRIMRTTVTTAIVLGAFAVCWLPTTVKFFVEVYVVTSEEDLFYIQTAAEVLSFGNSMVNPIIFGLRNDLFRMTYGRILRTVCCSLKTSEPRRSNRPMSTSSASLVITSI